jgi:hypothetical protein
MVLLLSSNMKAFLRLLCCEIQQAWDNWCIFLVLGVHICSAADILISCTASSVYTALKFIYR